MELEKNRTGIELKFLELGQKILTEVGLSLYDLEYITGSSTLRIFIFDPKTETALIEDCATVDRAFTPYVETLDWIPEKFLLEVSSPGVYRNLATKEHFEKAIGQPVRVSLMQKVDDIVVGELPKALKGNRKIIAVLKVLLDKGISLDYEGYEFEIPFEQIKRANLEPDI